MGVSDTTEKDWEEHYQEYFGKCSNPISTMIDDICKAYTELKEKQYLQACEENDFIVGTPIVKEQLKELLPDNANILVDMHIEPDKIYMIKKCILNPSW